MRNAADSLDARIQILQRLELLAQRLQSCEVELCGDLRVLHQRAASRRGEHIAMVGAGTLRIMFCRRDVPQCQSD
jgi:hypothetical protein